MLRRRITNGDEQDAYSDWARKYMIYLGRSGVRKSIKQATHKRERREGRRSANRGDGW